MWRRQKKNQATSHPSLGPSYKLWNEMRDMKQHQINGGTMPRPTTVNKRENDLNKSAWCGEKWPNWERSTTETTLSFL